MINQELIDYINQQLQQGVKREEIINILQSKGWQPSDIDEAFNSTNLSLLNNKNKRGHKKRKIIIILIFLILFIIATIYGIHFIQQLKYRGNREITKAINNNTDNIYTNNCLETINYHPYKVIREYFCIKNNQLYYFDKPLPNVDIESFNIIDENYIKDDNNIYYFKPGWWHADAFPDPIYSLTNLEAIPLEGVDMESFRILQGSRLVGKKAYLIDKNNTYIKDRLYLGLEADNWEYVKDASNIDMAVFKKDDSYCSYIDPKNNGQNKCRIYAAQASLQSSMCFKINDDYLRNDCYQSVAKDLNDVEICDKIEDNRRNWCINDIAIALNKPELCELIPYDNFDYCNYNEVRMNRDECQPGNMVNWCYKNVEEINN